MSRVYIDTALRQSQQYLYKSQNALQRANSQNTQMKRNSYLLDASLRMSLATCTQQVANLQQRVMQITNFVNESLALYEQTETTIQNNAVHMESFTKDANTYTDTRYMTGYVAPPISPWKTYFWHYSESEYNGFTLNRGLFNLIKNGAGFGGTYAFDIAKATYRNHIAGVAVKGDFAIGDAQISGSCRVRLKNKGKWDPNLNVQAGASVSAAHGIVSADWANAVFGAGVDAKVDVGVASAKAKAVISKKEVHIEGEVGVAAVKGQVSGTLNIFGITIQATAKGEAGAWGIGANYHTSSNSIEFGGKISCLFGGGFDIKIDW